MMPVASSSGAGGGAGAGGGTGVAPAGAGGPPAPDATGWVRAQGHAPAFALPITCTGGGTGAGAGTGTGAGAGNGHGFTLRAYRPDDLAAIVKHGNNRKVWVNLRDRFPHPYTGAGGVRQGWCTSSLVGVCSASMARRGASGCGGVAVRWRGMCDGAWVRVMGAGGV